MHIHSIDFQVQTSRAVFGDLHANCHPSAMSRRSGSCPHLPPHSLWRYRLWASPPHAEQPCTGSYILLTTIDGRKVALSNREQAQERTHCRCGFHFSNPDQIAAYRAAYKAASEATIPSCSCARGPWRGTSVRHSAWGTGPHGRARAPMFHPRCPRTGEDKGGGGAAKQQHIRTRIHPHKNRARHCPSKGWGKVTSQTNFVRGCEHRGDCCRCH